MSAINEYIDKIKSVLQSKKNADVYILNDKLTLSVFAVPDNKASEKVILANGGIYEKTITVDGKEINRYWIDISK